VDQGHAPRRRREPLGADPRALKIVLDMVRYTENRMDSAAPETASFSAEDEKVIAQLKARLRAKKRESDD
jgi:hypothetical protein